MELRARIDRALKDAMKAREKERVSTLRLIGAAIKDRDIALRTEDREVGEAEITAILARMVKQRQESARAYEEAGRIELAEKELAEIGVVEEFLPRPMDEAEIDAAVGAAISETGAGSIRDMGRVMGELKARHAGRMDFSKVGPLVRERLTG